MEKYGAGDIGMKTTFRISLVVRTLNAFLIFINAPAW
jgi:hypothetical protein